MRTTLSTRGEQLAGHGSGQHGEHISHTQRDAQTPRTNAIAAAQLLVRGRAAPFVEIIVETVVSTAEVYFVGLFVGVFVGYL